MSMYKSISEISQNDYETVPVEKDLIPTYQKEIPDMKKKIISHFNYMMHYWGVITKILDVKCALGKDFATGSICCSYLTKEKYNSNIRYMIYPLLEKPETLYKNECKRIQNPEKFAVEMGTIESPNSTLEVETTTEVYIRRFLSSVNTFEESALTKVIVAQNEICNSVKLTAQNVAHMTEVCKCVIKEHGSLVPFCQVCGDLDELWRFGKNYIMCAVCFATQFKQMPMKSVISDIKMTREEFVAKVKEIPYSEYLNYLSVGYEGELREYYTMDELNYERGRKIIYSSKYLSILDILTSKQQNSLRVLSEFFTSYMKEKRGVEI